MPPSRPLPPRLRQFSKPSDQLPDVGGRRHFRSPGAFRISDRIGKQCAAALIRRGIRLPIAVEVVFQLTNHLLAGGWSAEGASKGSVRVSEMEQQPVLEARNRDGCANRDGTCLTVRLPGQPRTEAFDICVSFVVVEDAPNFVEVGILLPLLLRCSRDPPWSPLSSLRGADQHVREIEIASEGAEVTRLCLGCLAQDQDSRQPFPCRGPSSPDAWPSSPGTPPGHRIPIPG